MRSVKKIFGFSQGAWIAGGAGLVIFVGVLASFRSPITKPLVPPIVPKPFANIARLGSVEASSVALREQAELFDPTPLFLPTEWNYEQRDLPRGLQGRPENTFRDFPEKLSFAEANPELKLNPPPALPTSPAQVLASEVRDPFLGIGREEVPITGLEPRPAFIEVKALGATQAVLRQVLDKAHPPGTDWAPLEFVAAVDASGLLGQPMLTSSSGAEEVDAYFGTFLSQNFRVGERLESGFYRLVIRP